MFAIAVYLHFVEQDLGAGNSDGGLRFSFVLRCTVPVLPSMATLESLFPWIRHCCHAGENQDDREEN